MKTTDAGITWALQSTDVDFPLLSVYLTDEFNGYACGYDGDVYKTINGGTSWTSQVVNTSIKFNAVFFTSQNTGYIAGSTGYIYKTENGGSTWLSQESGTSQELNSVCFVDANIGYAVGDSGTIIKTINGGANTTGIIDNSPTANVLRIFPNPASTSITIELPVPATQFLISILNLSGQVLISSHITDAQTLINISTLPPGVYFARVTTDRTVVVGKFVKQ